MLHSAQQEAVRLTLVQMICNRSEDNWVPDQGGYISAISDPSSPNDTKRGYQGHINVSLDGEGKPLTGANLQLRKLG